MCWHVARSVLGALALASFGHVGCNDDEGSAGATKAPTPIEVQPTDRLQCGFGVTPAQGPWDEVTLEADGAIKWTHVGPAATRSPEENFAKTGRLDDAATKAWLQQVAALGLTERTEREVADGSKRTRCRGALGGETVDFQRKGLPDAPLRAQLDALTARCITGE